MSNTICLSGPAFSVTGNLSYISQRVAFQLSFDGPADQATVKAYDWYLDGDLIIDQNQPSFNGTLSCGAHAIGARVLTDAGWTGVKTISFQTCRATVSTVISGPGSIDQSATGTYSVIATFSDNTSIDVTDEYTLSSPDGTFSGNVFTPGTNSASQPSRTATITASKDGFPSVSTYITITDSTYVTDPAVLVVDLYNNTSLNVMGYIDNAEVTDNHIAAYAGQNIVPVGDQPADALILASDFIDQSTLNWRFEFNIAKLLTDYPASTSFAFYIKGRGSEAAPLTGAYVLKAHDSYMTMVNSPGSYIPSVVGSNFGPAVNFSSNVAAGANGSYAEADLTTIIKLVYDVATKNVTYTTAQGAILVNDFDFMSVKYHWGPSGGTDLDIMVGFENTGTAYDGLYVGYGQGPVTQPATANPPGSAYLWWAADNTTSSGDEDVLIGMKQFVADFPDTPDTVEAGLYAVWYQPPITGDFTVELATYKDGTMSISGSDFVNTGGTQVSSNTVNCNTLIHNTSHTPSTSYKVGSIKYTRSTQSAIIEINS